MDWRRISHTHRNFCHLRRRNVSARVRWLDHRAQHHWHRPAWHRCYFYCLLAAFTHTPQGAALYEYSGAAAISRAAIWRGDLPFCHRSHAVRLETRYTHGRSGRRDHLAAGQHDDRRNQHPVARGALFRPIRVLVWTGWRYFTRLPPGTACQ